MKKVIILLILAVAILLTMDLKVQNDDVVTILNPNTSNQSYIEKYASDFTKSTGIQVEVYTPIEGETPEELYKRLVESGKTPDIFPISTVNEYFTYNDIMYDMSYESWVKETSFEFTVEGQAYGFPVAINGSGLLINTTYTDQLGIDLEQVNTYGKIQEMFVLLDQNKEELGIEGVLSFSLVAGEYGIPNLINILFSGSSIPDTIYYLNGDPYYLAYQNYIKAVTLLFDYSYGDINTKTYNDIIEDFATGQTAILFGSTAMLEDLNNGGLDTTTVELIPYSYNIATQDILPVEVDYFFCINKFGDVEESLEFLENIVHTEYGQDFLQNDGHVLPAFYNVEFETDEKSLITVYDAITNRYFKYQLLM